MIERNVDYIQASVLLSESIIIMKGFRPIPPVRFYKRGYLHPQGFRMYFGNPNSNKANVVGAGEVLGSLRNDGHTDAEILGWFLSQGAEISRLDLAVTDYIEDEFVTLEDVKSWAKQGLIDSPLISGGFTTVGSLLETGEDRLETFYVGALRSRARKGVFRAYDKGVEMGIGGSLITRLEIELKREKANLTAKKISESNDIAGNFRSRFDVKSKDFERLMDADAVKVTRGQNKAKTAENEALDKRWDWLLEQVASALLQAVKDDRAAGMGDARLVSFLGKAGLLKDMRDNAVALSKKSYYDYLVSIGIKNGSFSSEDLD